MNEHRILNRIVEINVANVKYADIELNGNTCFVGTNNFGKTSLQRAILFFYSANSRGLGISSSQKTFDDHYFRYENSYIIYEVATETRNFFVITYRQNKISFRFVDAPYSADYFFNEKDEALKIGEVLKNLERAGIFFSNQIDTFERYRNVIYGTEMDKNLSRFFLLRGNEKYQNIPKSITNVFLSSKSSVDSRFIKDFIANAITSETSGIKLDQVDRQLRQFYEKYSDIETYLKKESVQLVALIEKQREKVQRIKSLQAELAGKLGNNLRYAESQMSGIEEEIKKRSEVVQQSTSDFDLLKANIEDQQKAIREEIGYCEGTIRETNKRLKEYQKKNIDSVLEKYSEREKIQVDLNLLKKEYDTLTSNVKGLELKYSSLKEQFENEKNAYLNQHQEKVAHLKNEFSERQLLLRSEQSRKEGEQKERIGKATSAISEELTSKQIELNELKSEEKVIRNTRIYDREIKELETELQELRAVTYKNRSEKAIKSNLLHTLQKEWEAVELKLKSQFSNRIDEVNAAVKLRKEEISKIDSKLNIQSDAFYGFLESNFKNWHETIGKVCNEELLFRDDLNPEMKKDLANSLYGISLDLGTVPQVSKSISQYQGEKNLILASIRELENGLLQYQAAVNDEKIIAADRYGKQLGELREEVKVLAYSLELAEKREIKLSEDLLEWRKKENLEIENVLGSNRQKQNLVDEELSVLEKRRKMIMEEFKGESNQVLKYYSDRLSDIKDKHQSEIDLLEADKEKAMEAFTGNEDRFNEAKEEKYKSEGVDSVLKKELDAKMRELAERLRELEHLTFMVNDYQRDKREYFDKLPDFIQRKEEFLKRSEGLNVDLEEANRKFNLKRMQVNKEKREIEVELQELNNGMNYFEKNFKDTPVYNKYAKQIEEATPMKTNTNVMDVCAQLMKNDSHFNEEYGAFQRFINEFSGKFRLENHFNFQIRHDATQSEYEKFADYLANFVQENKIELSIAETAMQISLVTDSIATKVRELSNQQHKIAHIISLIAEDFKKAEFEESKLIEFIKIKLEESDNRIYKVLKKIEVFKDEHGHFYGEGLFNTDFATGKNRDVNQRAVRLLENLRQAIREEDQEEIRLQDLFELKFNIKEGVNETGWTNKIDSIGSTGTDILVKAIIYITLLHVFIKESSHRSSKGFKVHCIIDEVGQISAHYLKELLKFAKNRNIMMINGLPNKSGLESHYRFTYQFRKEEDNSVRIFPSIVTEVEA